jgi:phosphoribosylamine-glycine ligase
MKLLKNSISLLLVLGGGRILSITPIAKNKKMVFKNVYTDLKNIQIRNTRYRTDIGC